MVKVSDYVIRFIADQGVKHVFLVTGSLRENFLAAIDPEAVLRSGLGGIGDEFKPAVITPFKRKKCRTV